MERLQTVSRVQRSKKNWTRLPQWCKEVHQLLLTQDLSQLQSLSPARKQHAIRALTALSKYLGIPKQFKELRQQYDLKWSTGNSDMLIIQRLLKADKNGKSELINSVRAVKQQLPSFSVFIDFITATGLRYVEALNSLNLIIQLDKEGKLHSYYQDYILQHFSHPTVFIRRTKRVFISIVPPDIIQEIAASESLTENVKKKKLQRRKLSLHFSDLREYWATLMTRYLSQPEIDFLQGRISSVFIARACLEGI